MVRVHVETDDGIGDTQDRSRRASWPSHQVPLVSGLSSPHLVLQSVGTVCHTRHSPCRCGAKIPPWCSWTKPLVCSQRRCPGVDNVPLWPREKNGRRGNLRSAARPGTPNSLSVPESPSV